MTGKLFKYEMRSVIRQIGFIWIALPILALITGIMENVYYNQALNVNAGNLVEFIFQVAPKLIYGGLFVAMVVITLLIVILRFYKGLLRDEGYLMHTLPVKTWQLITAKGVAAALVTLVSVLVAGISIFLMVLPGDVAEVAEFFSGMFKLMGQEPQVIAYGLEVLILIIFGTAAKIYQVYASLSIGQLVEKHKVLFSVAAYIGINVVISILLTGLVMLGGNFLGDIFQAIEKGLTEDGMSHFLIWVVTFSQVLMTAIFHVVSERLLATKLNLE